MAIPFGACLSHFLEMSYMFKMQANPLTGCLAHSGTWEIIYNVERIDYNMAACLVV